MHNIFKGTGVALVTPFKSNGELDLLSLDKLVKKMHEGNVDFLLALGTTAETVTLSNKEQDAVVQQIIKSNNSKLPILLGVSNNNTAALVESTKTINFDGIDGILSVAPYYNKPNQRGIYAHFSELSKATDLPIILYNVPGRTSSNIAPETAVRLANDFANIIAIKEASGNMDQIMKLLSIKSTEFKVFSGDDALTMPMMALGVEGVISVVANTYPAAMSQMVNIMLQNGDMDKARSLHFDMLDIINAMFKDGNPAGVKSVLFHQGVMENILRLPMVAVNPDLDSYLKELVNNSKLK